MELRNCTRSVRGMGRTRTRTRNGIRQTADGRRQTLSGADRGRTETGGKDRRTGEGGSGSGRERETIRNPHTATASAVVVARAVA